MSSNIEFDFSNFDLTQLLPPHLAENPFFKDYLDATSSVWKDAVFPYMKALSELRQTVTYSDKQKQELWVLIRNANLLGYKFLSSYMTQDNYFKLNEFISRFYETQGTKTLPSFIGFIRGASLQLEQLWTAYGEGEYSVFVEKSLVGDDTIIKHPDDSSDGIYYPTSHYRLTYYLDQTGLLDNNVLQELFYNLAPIHFVLESVVARILFENEPYYIDVKASVYITESILVDHRLDSLTYLGTPLTSLSKPLETLIEV